MLIRRFAGFPILLALLLAFTPATASARTTPADPAKTIRIVFPVAETGFDPVRVHDLYSAIVVEAMFDRLITYDYLARPVKLVPQAAETLPEVSDEGRTFTFRIRKGIHFTPDPAFKGKRRELTAADYAYTLRRFMDPKNRSVWKFLLDGKIIGLDDAYEKAKKNADQFDYDAPVAGLEVVDRYTLRIRLARTDYNFVHILAMPTFGAVAREVIEAYPGDENAHPVGTGPYFLKRWVRSNKIFLEANPDYRGFAWDFAPGPGPNDGAIVAAMKGRRMPQVGNVEINVIEEEQSRWLAFKRGELDLLNLPESFAPIGLPDNKVAPDLAEQGVTVNRIVDPEITYTYFNMQDPVLGGTSKEKIALRRAIIMAYDTAEEIRVLRKGQAVAAEYIVPAGVPGHDPGYRLLNRYDPALANKLLDRMGYRKGADGFRQQPDGKPLTVVHYSQPTAFYRELDELWKKSLDSIGVRLEIRKDKFAELLKAEKKCLVSHRGAAWIADYPDGDNFMQLLYGPNIHESNNACFKDAEWDRLYEKSRQLPDGAERNRIFRDLNRRVEYLGVWKMGVSRVRNMLIQKRVQGYTKHPILHAEFLYVDVPAGKP